MSDDTPPSAPVAPAAAPPTPPAQSTFLTDLRDTILAGTSVYGDPNSPLAKAKLDELGARIDFGRQIGEIAPAPPPWTPQRVAQERLAHEFPVDPADPPNADLLKFQMSQIAALGNLTTREQADLAQRVVDDVGTRTSEVTRRYAFERGANGEFLNGGEVVAKLVEEARHAVAAFLPADKRADVMKLLPLDRTRLELWAARGRNIVAYAAAKARYGLS